MTRIKDRRKAIGLRKLGKTYSEIRRDLRIPKSTLSDWLGKYPLTNEQMALLRKSEKRNRYLSIEKIIATKRKKREARLNATYNQEKQRLLSLNKKELELAGLFLYWGEGSKNLKGALSINNTDPQVLKFILFWLKNVLQVSQDKIRVYLHLYSDMRVNKEMKFWSKELKLPLSQFYKPYIKKSRRSKIDHKGHGHGTCGLAVIDIRLKEKILMGIKAIADYYSVKI